MKFDELEYCAFGVIACCIVTAIVLEYLGAMI